MPKPSKAITPHKRRRTKHEIERARAYRAREALMARPYWPKVLVQAHRSRTKSRKYGRHSSGELEPIVLDILRKRHLKIGPKTEFGYIVWELLLRNCAERGNGSGAFKMWGSYLWGLRYVSSLDRRA